MKVARGERMVKLLFRQLSMELVRIKTGTAALAESGWDNTYRSVCRSIICLELFFRATNHAVMKRFADLSVEWKVSTDRMLPSVRVTGSLVTPDRPEAMITGLHSYRSVFTLFKVCAFFARREKLTCPIKIPAPVCWRPRWN